MSDLDKDLDKEIHKLAYEINVFLSKRQPIKEVQFIDKKRKLDDANLELSKDNSLPQKRNDIISSSDVKK